MMERLTRKVDGKTVFPSELVGVTLTPDNVVLHELLCRLADYEDTGLTPEQCENAKVIIESTLSNDTSKVERIRELLKADQDGRLVVLPCRVGDGLWTFCTHPVEQVYSFTVTDISTLNGRTMLNTSRCGVIDARDVGKTVFLTREEAEKVLKTNADVAPVVHGRWKKSGSLLECQYCGEIYSQLGGNAGKSWNYCPNCGAKIDGDGSGK